MERAEREAEEHEADADAAQPLLEAVQDERALQLLADAAGQHDDDDEDRRRRAASA